MNETRRSPDTDVRAETDDLASWSALVTVYQSVLHDVVAALDQEAGLDSGVFSALAYLERAEPPHRLPMATLQRAMHPRYSQPGFSRLVQRMEADGLVERRSDPGDRRATIIVTTRAGRKTFRSANDIYTDALRIAFGRHLRDNDHAKLAALLSRVGDQREHAERDGARKLG